MAEKLIHIAGPCSAESPKQLFETAKALKDLRLNFFRAGVWKPRTKPGSFEGVGEEALSWLLSIQNELQIHCCVEVASAQHVEAVLRHSIKAVWIGARTTVNPFVVQEIADALKGVEMPVMVKNPVSPDLKLWIGALERVQKAKKGDLLAIHRGFKTYEQTIYRNSPLWEIPIELKRQWPDLSIIVDPSHISGNRSLINDLAQKAIDLHFDGLMVEVHPKPTDALSDNAQQLTPVAYKSLMANLNVRGSAAKPNAEHTDLEDLRSKIDRIDNYIIELFAERMQIAEEIGDYKFNHKLAIHQPERWAATVKRALSLGKQAELSETFILQLFQKIHNESIKHQQLKFKV